LSINPILNKKNNINSPALAIYLTAGAGVLSYVNSSLGINALTDDMNLSDYVKNATIHGVGQGISSEIRDGEFKDGFATGATISLVSDGALQMRKYVKDNFDYVGDGKLSEGIRGDGAKIGGAHPVRVLGKNGEYKYVDVSGPTGGVQKGVGELFGLEYKSGSFFDSAIEYYAGPHDFMSSWNYQNIGGVTSVIDNSFWTGTVISGALIVPSIPFAVAPYIQDYLNSIQNYRYLKKDNKENIEKIIKKYEDIK